MNIHDGLVVEHDLVKALNNKRFADLSNNMKHLIKKLFSDATDESLILSKAYDSTFKADISISCEGVTKNLSIKTGRATTVHHEILEKFLDELKKWHISDETLNTLRLFHYGDNTLDGTGLKRVDCNTVLYQYKEQIEKANYELNTNREFVKSIVTRCLFNGAYEYYVNADAIYVGDIEYGVVATKDQILKHIERKYYSYYKCPHIGPLLLRPDARYTNTIIVDKRKRDRLIAYWPAIDKDIGYISNRYD